MAIVAIIQARMTSTRLPGKVLKQVLGKPMIGYQLERTRRCHALDEIVVATTTNATDDPIADYVSGLGIAVYRGSEHDVLSLYFEAAEAHDADIVVRMTADCPIIDPEVTDMVIERFLEFIPPLDYATNGIPHTWPIGLDTEVMTFKALRTAHEQTHDPYDREHVSPFIYKQPDRFRLYSALCPINLSGERWTLDTPEDLEFLTRVIETLYPEIPDFGYRDVLALLEQKPEWRSINADVGAKVRRWERQRFTGDLQPALGKRGDDT